MSVVVDDGRVLPGQHLADFAGRASGVMTVDGSPVNGTVLRDVPPELIPGMGESFDALGDRRPIGFVDRTAVKLYAPAQARGDDSGEFCLRAVDAGGGLAGGNLRELGCGGVATFVGDADLGGDRHDDHAPI